MEIQQQLEVLADELNLVKNELVGIKANHGALHTVTVETDRVARSNNGLLHNKIRTDRGCCQRDSNQSP